MVAQKKYYILLSLVLLLCVSCGDNAKPSVSDDSELKKMLEGVWVESEDHEVAFRIEGDSIYYPDSNIETVFFRVTKDTLYLDGKETLKYPIEKCSAHVLHFVNLHGEKVMLERIDDSDPANSFDIKPVTVSLGINQQLIKSDTVVTVSDNRYHCYMQVNPTKYKVARAEISNEGVEVERFYYDNMLYAAVYEGATKLFSSDFSKKDFAAFVPAEVLARSILNNISYKSCSAEGVVFEAEITMPGSASQYIVDINVKRDGTMKMSN